MFPRITILSIAVVVFFAVGVHADVPTSLQVQGRLTDSAGVPLPAGPKTFTFGIYPSAVGGPILWPAPPGEVHILMTDDNGLWNATLGSILPLADVVFADSAWLEITVDDGINPPGTLPRIKLNTSPYAFRTQTAEMSLSVLPATITSQSIVDGTIQLQDLYHNGAQPGQIMKYDGAAWVVANDSIGTGGDSDWILTGDVLYSGGSWGIARSGNILLGDSTGGHTNLGVACTTGNAFGAVRQAVVSGGLGNFANDNWSTVGGGIGNRAWSEWSTIAGGDSNSTNGLAATVAGGMFNKAHHSGASIGGGSTNEITAIEGTIGGGALNLVTGEYGTIGGGFTNRAHGRNSFVGGGGSFAQSDSNVASGDGAAVVGGWGNHAVDTCAVVGGGSYNRARGAYSVVAGGGGGGLSDSNAASGKWSTVPGGRGNVAAGDFSFASGRRAKAEHDGSFVWADSVNADFTSTSVNEFAIRAGNGLRLVAGNNAYGARVENLNNGDGMRVFSGVSIDNFWAAVYAYNVGTSPGLYAASTAGPAAYLDGDVTVTGILTKGGGGFKIDHPLDPKNKYLSHSFVESPDMMNVYNGNVTLDASGGAEVLLPDYFEALNRDFRYQLTAIGAPGPNLHVAAKVADNRFRIAGGEPGMEVSWQVTGIRRDAFANANRIPVTETKPATERGLYLQPEAFGLTGENGIGHRSKTVKLR